MYFITIILMVLSTVRISVLHKNNKKHSIVEMDLGSCNCWLIPGECFIHSIHLLNEKLIDCTRVVILKFTILSYVILTVPEQVHGKTTQDPVLRAPYTNHKCVIKVLCVCSVSELSGIKTHNKTRILPLCNRYQQLNVDKFHEICISEKHFITNHIIIELLCIRPDADKVY